MKRYEDHCGARLMPERSASNPFSAHGLGALPSRPFASDTVNCSTHTQSITEYFVLIWIDLN